MVGIIFSKFQPLICMKDKVGWVGEKRQMPVVNSMQYGLPDLGYIEF